MGISEKTIIEAESICDYIPQRYPMVMVDEFLGIKETLSVSALTIKEDNIFCIDGLFDECGIIEHIAQSAALRVGFLCKKEGREVPPGYIGSVNKFKLHNLPVLGAKIKTDLIIEHEFMNISLISATVRSDSMVIAECNMKIFLQQ